MHLKEERFILAHGFRGFLPWSLDAVAWACGEAARHSGESAGQLLQAARREEEKEELGSHPPGPS